MVLNNNCCMSEIVNYEILYFLVNIIVYSV